MMHYHDSAVQFWNPARLSRVVKACYLALGIALCLVLVFQKDSPMLRHGDFPGFYAPAVIFSEGHHEKIYDLSYQREVEGRYWQDFQKDFYIFAYPPYVARLLVPLAWFSPGIAQGIFLLINLLCVALSAWLMRRTFRESFSPLHTALLFLFPSLLTSIFGTQNTGISVFLFTCILTGLRRESYRGDLVAGMAAGLMLYKPQYGIIFILYLLAAKKVRAFIFSLSAATFLYSMAAIDFGFLWPEKWYAFASRFGDENFIINSHQMVSLSGGIYSLTGSAIIGYVLSALFLAAYYLQVAHRSWLGQQSMEEKYSKLTLLAFIAVILSPQTLYYDLSICLISVLFYLKVTSDLSVSAYLLFCVTGAVVFLTRFPGGVSFYFLYALCFFVFYLALQEQIKKSPDPQKPGAKSVGL